MSINIFATAKSAADGCWNNCPTKRSLREWSPHWPVSNVMKLKVTIFCYALSNISDVDAPLQSGEKDGIHGMQAFHMACKQ